MKLLRKYWLLLVFCLFEGFTFFYLMPRQENSYFSWDIERFSKTTTRVLLIIEGGLLCLLFVFFALKRLSVREALISLVFALPMMIGIFLVFKDSLAAAGLYVNQWSVRQRFERAYVAQYLNNDRSDETNFSLYDIESKKLLLQGDLVKAAYRSGPAPGDTIYARLDRGLLNVVYFGDTVVRKR